jgi:hypothetical protein
MSTAYAVQPRAINDRAPNDGMTIKLEYGVPAVFALRFVTGKEVRSNYPGGRYMFSSTDRGPLFLDGEDASDFQRMLGELGVVSGELIRVTKIKMAHGGGHALRVAKVSDADEGPDKMLVAQLEKSIEVAQREKNQRVSQNGAGPVATGPTSRITDSISPNPTPAALPLQAAAISPAAGKLAGALKAAIDACVEARFYAERLGMKLDFNEEDVRCLAITSYIQAARS